MVNETLTRDLLPLDLVSEIPEQLRRYVHHMVGEVDWKHFLPVKLEAFDGHVGVFQVLRSNGPVLCYAWIVGDGRCCIYLGTTKPTSVEEVVVMVMGGYVRGASSKLAS